MCDENKEKENEMPVKKFLMTGTTSSECYATVDQPMNNNETT